MRHITSAKIRNAVVLYRGLLDITGVEYRMRPAPDDRLFVNTHVYGLPAGRPLCGISGGSGDTNYLESFERVWDDATR